MPVVHVVLMAFEPLATPQEVDKVGYVLRPAHAIPKWMDHVPGR